jgi:FtsP/CotA-like multicopper oxidase with cupredoxin domain
MGIDKITGKPFDHMSMMYIEQGKNRIGRTYRKAVYREYTDGTFTTLKPRAAEWEHLGLLGPVLHAEVGDTIQVFFKNNGAQSYSMHPHGVFYEKNSEGSYLRRRGKRSRPQWRDPARGNSHLRLESTRAVGAGSQRSQLRGLAVSFTWLRSTRY